METIFDLIRYERARQDAKWGIRHQHNMIWLSILTEEVGEVAKAILKKQWAQMNNELIQCAAVCVAWLEDNYSNEPKTDDWKAG